MKKLNVFLKIKVIRWGVLPIALLGLWMMLTIYTINQVDSAFTVLSYYHDRSDFNNLTDNKLLAGQKITGQFKALENNLGIVSIKFRSFQKVAYEDEDLVVFRLKEQGQTNWYYTHTYKSGLFFNVPFYPFGFPKIPDSQGKTYVFELQSLHGTDYNGVAIDNNGATLASKYQENKSTLLANKKLFLQFLVKKFINAFQLIDIQFFSFVYLLPFFMYTFTLLPIQIQKSIISTLDRMIYRPTKKKTDYYFLLLITLLKFIKFVIKYYFDLLLIFLILLDIFVMQVKNDLVYIVIMSLWIATIKLYKHTTSRSLIIGFFFLALCPFILIFKLDTLAEKAAAWTYLFLLICVIQAILELKQKKV